MTICPCCGSEVTAGMLIDLNTNTLTVGDVALEIRPPQTIELLHILHCAWPRTVSYEVIADGLFGIPDDGRATKQHRQHIATLATFARQKIDRIGIGIEAISGRGFRLVMPHQAPATSWLQDRRTRVSA